jgi:hypothetical protein
MALGDFNVDGYLDVAVLGYAEVSVFFGDGAGGFLPPRTTSIGAQASSIAIADFNGDGNPDLGVAAEGFFALLGDGNGGFTIGGGPATTTTPDTLVIGDFNGDGKADVLLADTTSGLYTGMEVLLGDGSGGFSEAPGSPFLVGSNPYGIGSPPIATGDFDGDGKTDLFAMTYDFTNGKFTLLTLLGNGSGGFTLASGVSYSTVSEMDGVVVGDFNSDGRTDLAIPDLGDGVLVVLGGVAAAPVSVISVGPSSGSGAVQTFSGVFTAANNFHTDLQWVQMLFAVAPSGGGQAYCYVHYDVQGNSFWLYSDVEGFFKGPVSPGTASNTLQGSLCALNTLGSSVSGYGSQLRVNANVVFKQAKVLNVYMRAYTMAGVDTGWVQEGTWTTVAALPGTMTVAPSSGTATHGTQQTFTLTFPDPPGFAGAAFGWEQFLVAASSSNPGTNYCFVHYDRGGNGLWMFSNDLGYFLGPVTPGTSSSLLTSSTCSVNTGAATVQNTNGNLVVAVPVTLKSPMIGSQLLFQRSLTVLNMDTGFVQTGTLTVN